MKTEQAPVKPPEEFNGYSYNSTDVDKQRYEEKKRLYPTPRQDAEYAAMCAPTKAAPKAAPKAKRKPAGF